MNIIGPIPPHVLKLMPPEERKPLGKAGLTNAEIEAEQQSKTEKLLQENVARLLNLRGIIYFHQRMDKRTTGRVGQPDFLFAISGKACAFECKLPGETPNHEQTELHIAMRKNGWDVRIIFNERQAVDALNEMQKL